MPEWETANVNVKATPQSAPIRKRRKNEIVSFQPNPIPPAPRSLRDPDRPRPKR